MDQQRFLNYV